jgi:hypothetical protein
MTEDSKLLKLKREELKRCKLIKPTTYNRQVQCALMNLPETHVQINKTIGKGKYNYVNAIDINNNKKEKDKNNMNNLLLYSNPYIVVKHNILKTNTDILKHEAIIGMYCNYIEHFTSNFYYTYDIRKLIPVRDAEYVIKETKDIVNYNTNNTDKYGILGEFIENITFAKFLKRADLKPFVPKLMLQVLFSIYIAGRELGFMHFDLHDENIIIRKTNREYVEYTVPLSPRVYKKIFGTYKNGKQWDLKKNVWIFDSVGDDPDSFRAPINYDISKYPKEIELKECMFENIKVGKKYHRPYKHFKVKLKTHGYFVEIIDYNFSTVKINNKTIMSRHTKRLYDEFDFKVPKESLLFVDMFRICYIIYSNYNGILNTENMTRLFGRYFDDILFKKIRYVEDLSKSPTESRILKENIDIHDPEYEYTGKTASKFIYAVDIDAIQPKYKNNEFFMNLCFDVFENIEYELS